MAEILTIFVIVLIYHSWDFIKEIIPDFRNKYVEKSPQQPKLTKKDFEEAIRNRTYGNFSLPKAVALFKNSEIIPKEGYKIDQFVSSYGILIDRLIVSVSAERILDLFDDLLSLVADSCGVVVEDFEIEHTYHIDHFAYNKDTVVVRSILVDFDELLLKDGFVGIAIFSDDGCIEVQLTDHKVIQIYAVDTSQIREVLAEYGIKEDPDIKFFYEEDHIHISADSSNQTLEALKNRLCIDQSVRQGGDSSEFVNY